MTDKLKIWDERAKNLAKTHPLKTLGHLPNIPGITPETSRFLRWKSLVYLLRHDKNHIFKRYFWKHPFKYTRNILKSYARKKPYVREGDFFLYNFSSLEEFQKSLNAPLAVVGFSYCHKPLECPSGRFTDQCIHDENHPVCGQCFIGKAFHALPAQQTKVFFIPTVHYIGEQFFKLLETYRAEEMVFLITACEMTLEMFGDWGNMLNIRGAGVRLDGRICNTMKAFELSEVGIKPGLTIVRDETQDKILELIRLLREKV
ncbi:MAG: hypothetical protein JSS10_05695 [Verrucomicrobia bacterium]|nr:hypothetical protein [Verrucomicrobiota bacterium]